MKKSAVFFAALPLFGVISFTSSKALADSSAVGIPNQVISLNKSNDLSPWYRGAIQLNNHYYFWGGQLCSSYTYEPSDVSILSDAVTNKKNITIFYKSDTSGAPCLTGIILNGTSSNAANSNALPMFRPQKSLR